MTDCIWPVTSSRTVVREDGMAAPEGQLGDVVKMSAPLAGIGYYTYVRVCGQQGGSSGLCHRHEGPAIKAVMDLILTNEIGPDQLEELVRTVLAHRWAADLVRDVLDEDVKSRLTAMWGAA